MKESRNIARITGILFIIGTAAGILSVVFTTPALAGENLLTSVQANKNQMLVGALLVLLMALALAMVPAVLYPILKKQNQVLALGYVIFRGALEAMINILIVSCWLFLIVISQEAASSGATAFNYQALGTIILKTQESLSNLLTIVFSLDAVMLYVLLFKSRLVPRWISVWGFIGIGLHFSTAFLVWFGGVDNSATILSVMNFPIFLQEMVMAVWLIAKGFNTPAPVFLQAGNK